MTKGHTKYSNSNAGIELWPVGLGKNMGNLILAIDNIFSLNKKFDSGLFFQCNTVAQWPQQTMPIS